MLTVLNIFFHKKLNKHILYDAAVLFLGIYQTEVKALSSKRLIQKCPWLLYGKPQIETIQIPTRSGIDKYSIQTMQGYTAVKKNKLLTHASIWRNLTVIMLTEKKVRHKRICILHNCIYVRFKTR